MLSVLLRTVVPHITDAIQEWVERVACISVDDDKAEPDICIIEVSSYLLFDFVDECQCLVRWNDRRYRKYAFRRSISTISISR
jgi:hypothetical protein